jgi:DNA-nicking Smr family endonuclease
MTPPGGRNAPSVDLHGLHPDQALRRLSQALHAARVAGAAELSVITGRGWGNRAQEPVLRRKAEAYLRGPEAKRFGVRGVQIESQGGSLRVSLARPAKPDS